MSRHLQAWLLPKVAGISASSADYLDEPMSCLMPTPGPTSCSYCHFITQSLCILLDDTSESIRSAEIIRTMSPSEGDKSNLRHLLHCGQQAEALGFCTWGLPQEHSCFFSKMINVILKTCIDVYINHMFLPT